jgi:hypothetical protein
MSTNLQLSQAANWRELMRILFCGLLVWILPITHLFAGYKSKPYVPLSIESYPSRLTSEGLTVAVDPMFTDALAAKAFDKKDIVASGIMPLAIIISNSNSFAVEIDGASIELLVKGDRIRPVSPEQAVMRVFQHTLPSQEVRVPSPIPFPRVTVYTSNADALDDFNKKHFGVKRIEPNSVVAAFIYVPVKVLASLPEALSEAQIYIPDLYRTDNNKRMMFLEIDLQPAGNTRPTK